MSKVILNSNNFKKEVEEEIGIVLVDFWAPWCGPCKLLGPIIKDLSNEFEEQIKIGKLNVDEGRQIAERFGIRGIPTTILFERGQEIERFVGVRNKAFYKEQIEKHLE